MTWIAGRYEIREELPSRPPVRRFRALDVKSGEDVFIKTLRVADEDIEAFMRLQEDAALISALDHPNIYKVHRAFVDNGFSCVVGEAIDAPDLGEILRKERLPLHRIRTIALQIASALAYGHDRNVVHRDLVPENVLVTSDDRVKIRALRELGKARRVRGAGLPVSVSELPASPYSSPEQRAGQTVGPRTDLYSLGAILYHMVTGHPPVDETLSQEGLPFADPVPLAWQSLIARAMAGNERYRFADAKEMGEAIARLPVPNQPPATFQKPQGLTRCPACGREARGRFCTACGAPIER